MTKSDESAFPVIVPELSTELDHGLTKRELFAAMALQGMLSRPMLFISAPEVQTEAFDRLRQTMATDAVRNADALIKELAKGDGK